MPPKDTNQGQEQLHRVGTIDPATGVITPLPDPISQADWRTRDKSSNLVRIDEDGAEIPETDESVIDESATDEAI